MTRVARPIAIALLLAGCGPGTEPRVPVVTRLAISAPPDSLWAGDTVRLTATVLDAEGAPMPGRVAWSSTALGTAFVDETGRVIGINGGVAWIRATYLVHDSVRVRVVGRVDTVHVVLGQVAMQLGRTLAPRVELRDRRGAPLTGRAVNWTSRSPSVAAIDNSGAIRAWAAGSTWIVAQVENRADSAELRVVLPVARVTLDLPDTSDADSAPMLTAAAYDVFGLRITGLPVRFTSLDTAAATVDAFGRTAWRRLGPAVFRADVDGFPATDTTIVAARLAAFEAGFDGLACGLTAGYRRACITAFTADRRVAGPIVLDPPNYRSLGEVASLHGCDTHLNGNIECRGLNNAAQLGSTTFNTPFCNPPVRTVAACFAPTYVPGPADRIATGLAHTCALSPAGLARCWGQGNSLQLGDGRQVNFSAAPVTVDGAHFYAMLTGGQAHTCGVGTDGRAWCWGANASGQGGNPGIANIAVPQEVGGGHRFGRISAGYNHTCALDSAAVAWCWGTNAGRQLGTASGDACGTQACSVTPLAVGGSLRFLDVDAGANATCAIATDGTPWCWGTNARVASLAPTPVSVPAPLRHLSVSLDIACARADTGPVYCWVPLEGTTAVAVPWTR